MSNKLHELLAVETDLASRAKSGLSKIIQKFGEINNYLGQRRTYNPLVDGGQPLPNENKQLPDRVNDDLNSFFSTFGKWIDASVQKEVTNQNTSADIVVGDEILIKDLPAPALLNLESKLAELGKVLKTIPVNDTAQPWSLDDQVGAYVSEPRITYRTEKVMKHSVAYDATEHHPAQVETSTADERIGEWLTIIHSGMLQPTEKRQLVERWESLSLAVKKARQRANDTEVDGRKISDIIFTYLRG